MIYAVASNVIAPDGMAWHPTHHPFHHPFGWVAEEKIESTASSISADGGDFS
jgi:hypothetical protein